MPNLPSFNAEERIQSLKEIGILEWICDLRPTHAYWKGLENTASTSTVRNKFRMEAPEVLKVFVTAFLYMTDFTVGYIAT